MNPRLENAFARLKRRLLAVSLVGGLARGLLATLLLQMAWMWLDLVFELPPHLRILSWLTACVLGLSLVARSIALHLRLCTPHNLARRVDALTGSGGQVLSGVDLAAWLATGRAVPADAGMDRALTPALAQMAVDQAAEIAGSIEPAAVVPACGLRWPVMNIVLVALVLTCVGVMLPDLAATQWLRFFDPRGDHPPYSRIRLYVEPGDVEVVYGEPVTLRAEPSGGSVERVELVLLNLGGNVAKRLPMFPEAGGTWSVTIANMTESQRYYVTAERARSKQFGISVLSVPKLEQVRFRVTPPAYTRRAAYEGEVPKGGIVGLPRTHVRVTVTSNKPLSGGEMMIAPLAASHVDVTTQPTTSEPSDTDTPAARQIPMLPAAEPHEVVGEFDIDMPGRLTLHVIDKAGQRSKETFTTTVALQRDERPFVRMLEPLADSLATPEVAVPVALAAEDDFSLSRVQLYRSLNDSRPRPVDLALPVEPPAKWTGNQVLSLSSHGLSPGDVIRLFARVEDNDPDGTKSSESAIATIRIISQQDYERLLRIRQEMSRRQTDRAEFQVSSGMGSTVEQLLADAGLSMNPAMGMGGDDGYSTSRSTLANVGMYGHMPTLLDAQGQSGQTAYDASGGRGSARHAAGGQEETNVSVPVLPSAADAAAQAPPGYRHKVGQYFERIADETRKN